ncbi:MAG TPA: DUF6569 family protein [Phycisphaerae bacterium]|nr:DUF6569 family protein [Phycisphaerae bacterium]
MTQPWLRRGGGWFLVGLALLAVAASAAYIEEEFQGAPPSRPEPRILPPPPPSPPPPPPGHHVPALAAYLNRLEVRRPLVHGRLAVFPVALRGRAPLAGGWRTTDAAIAKGILVVSEKGGGGTVPVVVMENRGRHDWVFVMAGEVISGGKQTRTVRQDTVLAPGQRVETPVFCVEARRWRGADGFTGGALLVPQSIQREMRKGADQGQVWAEVARNNAALGAGNATDSLELGLKAGPVRRDLDEVRRSIAPEVPADSVGFIFADRLTGRGLGAEFFGRADLAGALLGKLIDAYAVDLVLQAERARQPGGAMPQAVAWDFLDRVRRAGSRHGGTPGSGAGIGTQAGGLVGDGVALGDDLVHFGCQVEERILTPPPVPRSRRGGAEMWE